MDRAWKREGRRLGEALRRPQLSIWTQASDNTTSPHAGAGVVGRSNRQSNPIIGSAPYPKTRRIRAGITGVTLRDQRRFFRSHRRASMADHHA